MFREMVRKNRQISNEECIEILKSELRGVLSVLGDDDYPYGMPVNHFYNEEDGKIYIHGGPSGHKIDSIKKHDKVSLCVYDKGYRNDGEWALNIRSVIVFGRAKILEDHEKTIEISRKLSCKFTEDVDYIEREIQHSGAKTVCIEITPEHISGKLVNEA